MGNTKYTDDAITTLASSVAAIDTSIIVVSNALFAGLASAPTFFYATLRKSTNGAKETVKVTDNATATWTVTRAQGPGESALAFDIGDAVSIRIGKNLLDAFAHSDDLADTIGADLIGKAVSGTVQDFIDALIATTGAGLIGRTLGGDVQDFIDSPTTVAEIRAANLAGINRVQTLGYYTSGGGGSGNYWNDTSDAVTADDGFLCIVSNDSQRMKLIIDDNVIGGKLSGAKGDDSTDDVLKLNLIQTYFNSVGGGTLLLPYGTFIVSDDTLRTSEATGLHMFSDCTLQGVSRSRSIVKMEDGAVDGAHVIQCGGGASMTWDTGRKSNITFENLTIDGNRENHTKQTGADVVTTAASAVVTSAAGVFASAQDGDIVYLDRQRTTIGITNIVPDGTNAIVTAIGHDYRVGELVLISNVNGTGSYIEMNNNSFTVTAVTKHVDEQYQSFTVVKTLSSGVYTDDDAGSVIGGVKGFVIDVGGWASANSVTLTENCDATTTGTVVTVERGETGAGIEMSGCDNVDVRNVTIKNCWGDGIFADKEFGGAQSLYCKKINILNSTFDGNRRQGISFIAVDGFSIDNCWIFNTGLNGVGPGAGIDFEPEGSVVANGSVTNCQILDNEGSGIAISKQYTDTSGTPLTIDAASMVGVGNVRFSGNQILRNKNSGVFATFCNEGILFEDNNVSFNRRNGFRLYGTNGAKVFANLKIIDNVISWNQFFKGSDGDIDDKNNGHGIFIGNAAEIINTQNMLIAENSIIYNDGHGIYCSGVGVFDIHIKDNMPIEGNGQRLDDTYSNIRFEGTNVLGIQITGNKVNQGAGTALAHPYLLPSGWKQSKYGIEVITTGTYRVLVEDNYVNNAGKTADILTTGDRNDTVSGQLVVRNNTGYKTESKVVSAALNSATTNAAAAPQSATIAHGLAITPLARNCVVTMTDDIGGTEMTTVPIMHCPPYVSVIDGTDVTVKWSIATGGVNLFRINVDIRADNFI